MAVVRDVPQRPIPVMQIGGPGEAAWSIRYDLRDVERYES